MYFTQSKVPVVLSGAPLKAPVNFNLPRIMGGDTVGDTLTCDNGGWSANPNPTYAFQWKRNGGNIGGANTNTYTLVNADFDQDITCEVTATNSQGSGVAESAILVPLEPLPVNTVAPVISGNELPGTLLSVTNGTWTSISSLVFTYQWERNGVDISGANTNTYTTTINDIGKQVTCDVTATNTRGSVVGSSSNGIVVSKGHPINTVPPVITGIGYSGQQMQTDNGTWISGFAITFSYQWKSNGSSIAGETNNIYNVDSTTEGTHITCDVTATNVIGSTTQGSNIINQWVPTDDNFLVFWIDGSDSSTITQNSGAVSQLDDKSGNGLHQKQASLSSQPVTNLQTLNGLNAIYFDGSMHTETDPTALTQSQADSSLFITYARIDSVSNRRDGLISIGPNNTTGSMELTSGDNNNFQPRVRTNGIATTGTSNINYTPAPNTGPSVYEVIIDNVTEIKVQCYVDGVIGIDQNINRNGLTTSPANIRWFASQAVNRFAEGVASEFLLSEDVSPSTREKYEGYLSWKYGTQSNLPITHTYKASPPLV